MAKDNKKERTYFNLGDDWEVVNARKLDFGTFFTLRMPGLSLYDLRVVPEGNNYDAFVAMPEKKGSDGEYHKLFALYLSYEDNEAVIEAVDEALKESKKRKK